MVFPSWWSLPEKVGRTLPETHGIVPGLNAAIGPVIDRLLNRLKPGTAAERSHWGMAGTQKLNLHPALGWPRLRFGHEVDAIWLRIEHQILASLPRTGAILFGIRLETFPLKDVLADKEAKLRFHRALTTMPGEMVAYKGLAEVWPTLQRLTTA
ncbi:MAG: DUF3445 domain-containing protein [Candidatus Synoicihabitans palmerolidicus]|nr:DUF3445 domain-containing protein [Candidatus Synoicihabitans palmerolidicus]